MDNSGSSDTSRLSLSPTVTIYPMNVNHMTSVVGGATKIHPVPRRRLLQKNSHDKNRKSQHDVTRQELVVTNGCGECERPKDVLNARHQQRRRPLQIPSQRRQPLADSSQTHNSTPLKNSVNPLVKSLTTRLSGSGDVDAPAQTTRHRMRSKKLGEGLMDSKQAQEILNGNDEPALRFERDVMFTWSNHFVFILRYF